MDDLPVDAEDDFLLAAEDASADDPSVDLEDVFRCDLPATILSQRVRLEDIARSLKAGEPVAAVTVRVFLSWFWGSQRRGRWIVSYIREQLDKAGLKTVPDFESTYLDADISFELSIAQKDSDPAAHVEIVEAVQVTDNAETKVAIATFADPTYRISKLASANQKPISAKPDSSLTEAITIMMANDFFQLPVMVNDREVKGIVSWETIGTRLALGQSPQWVREVVGVEKVSRN
jgi:CBS domain-containing protein